jgi:TrmH RNA methyltransferase
VLVLENIGNPHNLGAILRTAAHFGAAGVLLAGDPKAMPRLSATVHRTAEGGLESVPVVRCRDTAGTAAALRRAGCAVVATSSRTGTSLYGTPPPARAAYLFGSEAEGLTPALCRQADACVRIPGTGAVESLNVACAAAVVLAEFRRVYPLAAAAGPDRTEAHAERRP